MSNTPKARNTKAAARPKSLRDALSRKTTRIETFRIPLVPSAHADKAAELYTKAKAQLEYAEAVQVGNPDDKNVAARVEGSKKLVAETRAALDECFWPVEIRAIGDDAFDALINEHPPTEEQQADGQTWNGETLVPALLAAAVVDGDLTAEEWAAELADEDRWTPADRGEISRKAYTAQRRSFSDGIPFD